MENYFLTRFQRKTRAELQRIVDNPERYRTEAVLAATKLLNEKIFLIPDDEAYPKEDKNLEVERPFTSFDYRPFFRTLSYREFLTSISIALFALAVIEIINYYSDERFFEGTHSSWTWFTILLAFPANHIIYRYEHRRSNNFIGRSINDLFLLVSLIIVVISYRLIIGGSYNFRIIDGVLSFAIVVIGITMTIFSFEIGLGFLKIILKKIRCQIF